MADSIEQNFTDYPSLRQGINNIVALMQAMDRELKAGRVVGKEFWVWVTFDIVQS